MALLALSRTSFPASVLGAALGIAGASAACGSDTVATFYDPGAYDVDSGYVGGSSSSGVASSAGSGGSSSGSTSGPSSSGSGSTSGSGSSSRMASSSSNGSSGASEGGTASCDISGYWLAVAHSVAFAASDREVAHQWFYYELTQSGTAVTVKKGLHCGLEVVKDPNNVLGGDNAIFTPAGLAAFIAKQDEGKAYGSHPARTGTMTKTASGCQFHLNKYYLVRGATIPYYLDPSTTMSATMPQAMGSTPGWEDWDNDGNPGVTLNVSGTATGNIYAAQRDFSEFFGTVALGATKFEVGVVDSSGNAAVGPEQYAISYGNGCSGICGLSSTVDACPTSGCASEFFVDWVKLDSPPASTDSAICMWVTNNAKTMTPRAMDANSVPTVKWP